MFALTFDLDWAPDFVIEELLQYLEKRNIPATFYVTHDTPLLSEMRKIPELFELGIHPNFLPGSTHGDSVESVLGHCLGIVPEAKSLRTHALVSSTPLLQRICEVSDLRIDLSLFVPRQAHLTISRLPVRVGTENEEMIRIPFFYEDDLDVLSRQPLFLQEDVVFPEPGLKVFNFHPIHLSLNSCDFSTYERFKDSLGVPLRDSSREDLKPWKNPNRGVQNFLEDLVQRATFVKISELVEAQS